jgi:hypothetical protein
MAWHTLAGKYARRKGRGANRTLYLEHVTVRFGTTAEAVAANNASEAATLGGSDDVDKLFVVEDVDQYAIASLYGNYLFALHRFDCFEGDFFDHPHRRNVRLGEVASHGLVDFGGLDEVDVPNLGCIVAILRLRLELGNNAWASLKYGDRVNVAAIIEDLSHTDLFPENSDY